MQLSAAAGALEDAGRAHHLEDTGRLFRKLEKRFVELQKALEAEMQAPENNKE